MKWEWTRLPPLMQRSLWDDVKWAACVLLGVAAGYVLLGANNPGLLIGALAGVVIVIAGLTVARWLTRRRST